MGHPDYVKQLRDEIGDLIAEAMERDGLTEKQVQDLLLDLAGEHTPFNEPTVRGEYI